MATYNRTPVGADVWVRPDDTTNLQRFQIVAAAAKALQSIRRIEIIETHEENEAGSRLIDGIHIRRLR